MDGFAGFGIKAFVLLGLQEVLVVEDVAHEAAVLVEDPGEAAGHACSEVEAGGAEDDGEAAGHVFAAVVADAFDDGQGSGVADGEALAGAAGSEEGSAGGSVERDVAEDDVQLGLEGGTALASEDDFAAGQALADEVVGDSFEDELHAGDGEGSEGLAGDAGHLEDDRVLGRDLRREMPLELSSARSPARRAPTVRSSLAMRASWTKGSPALQAARAGSTHASSIGSDGRWGDCCGALPMRLAARRSCQEGRQVQSAVEADLFEQIGAADGGFERGQAELREQDLQVAGELFEEADDVLGLAAELGAQLGRLRGDAGGTGVEVALPGHVAAESDENRGAEGVLVGSEHERR